MSATVHYVVLDACALMPTILRRLLLRVAATGAYAPVWSARIGDEWRRNAARLWQMPLADLEAEWAAMNAAFPDADQGKAAFMAAFPMPIRATRRPTKSDSNTAIPKIGT